MQFLFLFTQQYEMITWNQTMIKLVKDTNNHHSKCHKGKGKSDTTDV